MEIKYSVGASEFPVQPAENLASEVAAETVLSSDIKLGCNSNLKMSHKLLKDLINI